MYYYLLNLWIMSSSPLFLDYFRNPKSLIFEAIINIVKGLSREKISRVAFKILANLCHDTDCIQLFLESNISQLIVLEHKKNLKDPELIENLRLIEDVLDKNLKIVSSFEKYIAELKTEKLKFGPRHTDKFWKENYKKFEENDFIYIRKLISLLQTSDDETKEVICFDLGEFSRYHPFSKLILEKYNGKQLLMDEIKNNNNQAIREQALMAVQKLMIHNWQNLQVS